MGDRYKIYSMSDALKERCPGFEDRDPDAPIKFWEGGWYLYECDRHGKPIREVFNDRMEPEDAILVRDLQPLVHELNRLAEELEIARKK